MARARRALWWVRPCIIVFSSLRFFSILSLISNSLSALVLRRPSVSNLEEQVSRQDMVNITT